MDSADVARCFRNQKGEAAEAVARLALDYAGLDPIRADCLVSHTNSERQRSCCGLGSEDIRDTWDENHLRTTLPISSAVEHLADSVDLLAPWPSTAPNHGHHRIIASTQAARDLLPAPN